MDAAHAERDAYKLSAQELQERSKVGLLVWLLVSAGHVLLPSFYVWHVAERSSPLGLLARESWEAGNSSGG